MHFWNNDEERALQTFDLLKNISVLYSSFSNTGKHKKESKVLQYEPKKTIVVKQYAPHIIIIII